MLPGGLPDLECQIVGGQEGENHLTALDHLEQKVMRRSFFGTLIVIALGLHDVAHAGGLQQQGGMCLATYPENFVGLGFVDGAIDDRLSLDGTAFRRRRADMHQELVMLPRISDRMDERCPIGFSDS